MGQSKRPGTVRGEWNSEPPEQKYLTQDERAFGSIDWTLLDAEGFEPGISEAELLSRVGTKSNWGHERRVVVVLIFWGENHSQLGQVPTIKAQNKTRVLWGVGSKFFAGELLPATSRLRPRPESLADSSTSQPLRWGEGSRQGKRKRERFQSRREGASLFGRKKGQNLWNPSQGQPL